MQNLSAVILPFALKTVSSEKAEPDGPPIAAVDLIVLSVKFVNYLILKLRIIINLLRLSAKRHIAFYLFNYT